MSESNLEWIKGIILVNVLFQSHGINKPERYNVRVSPNTTIENFKMHLKKSKGIMGKLSLERNGPELNPRTTLKKNGIRDGSQLFLKSFTPRRKFTHRIQVEICNANIDPIKFKFNISPQAHISDLAHMLQDECGMPVDEQAWFKGDIPLKNKSSLAVAMDDQRSRTRILKVKWSPKGTHTPAQTADPQIAAQNATTEHVPSSPIPTDAATACRATQTSPHSITTSTVRIENTEFDKKTAPSRDRLSDKPTFGELYKLKSKSQESVNVIEEVASTWPRLAHALNIRDSKVQSIRKSHEGSDSAEKACEDVFRHWMNAATKKPVNWKTLIEALEDIDHNNLAMNLKSVLTEEVT